MLTVLSFGAGQDSTTILAKLIEQKRNDFIVIMSDTGNEHPETYAHVKQMQKTCYDNNVKFFFIKEDMGYHGSWGNLVKFYKRTNTCGSKAFYKTCTDNLKITPIYNFLEDYISENYGVAKGRKKGFHEYVEKYGKITIMVGIARGEERRCADQAKFPKWRQASIDMKYPLIEWGMDRQDCQDYLKSIGWKIPLPSNCIICPWMNDIELLWLYRFMPEWYHKWVVIESKKLQANIHVEKNYGVWGAKLLPEMLLESQKKYPDITDQELQDYKMSHGHCVMSKY